MIYNCVSFIVLFWGGGGVKNCIAMTGIVDKEYKQEVSYDYSSNNIPADQ